MANEGSAEVLSGKYDACILPKAPRENFKLAVQPLFKERYLLAFAKSHPLADYDVVPAAKMASEPYADRLSCESAQ